jgi:putative transposase
MICGYRYRIRPNKDQKVLLEKHIGSGRFVYNKLLNIKKILYEKFRISISEFDLNNHLTVLKNIYPFLKEINSQSLQQASKNLNSAYTIFFKEGAGFPKKKSKKNPLQSFQIPQHYRIEGKKIWIPKVGWMKIKLHRDMMQGHMKTATISRTPTGKYYISIIVENDLEYPEKQDYSHATMIGIDVGNITFATLSNGEKIDHPKFLKFSLQRLKCLQKRVSRKIIGSNNRRKAVKKLAKIHELISNQRNDFQHKVSKKLISENQAIAVETLNIKGMMSNHRRAQSTGDSAWYSFVLKLQYKAEWFGKTIVIINQWLPSSKTCNICGYKHPNLTENIREWQCPDCKTLHDRDINAAINIKNFVFSPPERREEPVDSLAQVRGMKQEASLSRT